MMIFIIIKGFHLIMNSSFVGVACSDSTFQINTDKGTHLKGVVIVLSVTKLVLFGPAILCKI